MVSPPYDDLPTSTSIRLLNIDPDFDSEGRLVGNLSFLDLRNEEGYSGFSALSYEWGLVDAPGTIVLNGQPTSVRQNLWDFLMQSHRNGWYANLWIDALCINQKDVKERNSQVSMMSEIYSRACHVLVWMGKLSEFELMALTKLDKEIDEILRWQKIGYRHNGWQSFTKVHRDGMRSLVRNSYWKRKWIVQEIGLAGPNASLVVRYGTIPLHRILTFMFEAQSMTSEREDLNWYKSDLRIFPDLIPAEDKLTRKPWELTMLLGLFSGQKCSEPKDHIYALLSLAKPYDIKVDYSRDITDEYWEVLSLLHKEKDASHHLRLFSASLQHMMKISDAELLASWQRVAKEDCLMELFGYQFIEAMQMMLGELNEPRMKMDKGFDMRTCSQLPTFCLDYAGLHLARKASAAHDAVMEVFRHVVQSHESTLDDPAQCVQLGPCLGDYFIGVVSESSQQLTSDFSMQADLYGRGAKLIPFLLENLPFSSETSHHIDFGRRSDLKHLFLESAAHAPDLAELLAIQKDNIICMFSGHQSAMAIRRISTEQAVCGSVVVQMRGLNSLEKLRVGTEKMKMRMRGTTQNTHIPAEHTGEESSASEDEEEQHHLYNQSLDKIFNDEVASSQSSSVRVFFRPHCVIDIWHWTPDIRRPWKPYLNHCRCKPGGGGCL